MKAREPATPGGVTPGFHAAPYAGGSNRHRLIGSGFIAFIVLPLDAGTRLDLRFTIAGPSFPYGAVFIVADFDVTDGPGFGRIFRQVFQQGG
jgi:hypothetical protein